MAVPGGMILNLECLPFGGHCRGCVAGGVHPASSAGGTGSSLTHMFWHTAAFNFLMQHLDEIFQQLLKHRRSLRNNAQLVRDHVQGHLQASSRSFAFGQQGVGA